ncbi:MAG: hypothetical protein ACYDB7_13540, partial [Mycobacteriales bacterium]
RHPPRRAIPLGAPHGRRRRRPDGLTLAADRVGADEARQPGASRQQVETPAASIEAAGESGA